MLSKFNNTEIKKNEILKKKIMDNFEYIIKKDFLFLMEIGVRKTLLDFNRKRALKTVVVVTIWPYSGYF